MPEKCNVWSAVDIARCNDLQIYEVQRAIEYLDMQCFDVVGSRKVYNEEQIQKIIGKVAEMKAKRND